MERNNFENYSFRGLVLITIFIATCIQKIQYVNSDFTFQADGVSQYYFPFGVICLILGIFFCIKDSKKTP